MLWSHLLTICLLGQESDNLTGQWQKERGPRNCTLMQYLAQSLTPHSSCPPEDRPIFPCTAALFPHSVAPWLWSTCERSSGSTPRRPASCWEGNGSAVVSSTAGWGPRTSAPLLDGQCPHFVHVSVSLFPHHFGFPSPVLLIPEASECLVNLLHRENQEWSTKSQIQQQVLLKNAYVLIPLTKLLIRLINFMRTIFRRIWYLFRTLTLQFTSTFC